MLSLAFSILSVTVIFGMGLGIMHLRAAKTSPPWPIGAMHGLLGAGGLSLLVVALRGPVRGAATGVSSFGLVAAILAGAALLAGLILLALVRFKVRGKGLAIAVHATIAIAAYVILLAYVSLG